MRFHNSRSINVPAIEKEVAAKQTLVGEIALEKLTRRKSRIYRRAWAAVGTVQCDFLGFV